MSTVNTPNAYRANRTRTGFDARAFRDAWGKLMGAGTAVEDPSVITIWLDSSGDSVGAGG